MSIRKKRSDVAVEETWDLADLFATDADWEQALTQVNEDVKNVAAYKGKLTENAKTLLEALTTYEKFQEQLIRVATYANLKVNTDGSDPTNQANAAKVAASIANISAQLSFIESELLATSEATIEQYLQEETELETYRVMLDDILTKKAYTLSPETEEILAALSEVHDAPYMIYQRSKSSDMEFESVVDEDGNELPMSFALYEDRYEFEPNTNLRHKAFDSFVKTLNNYKHTYAAVYATEVTKQVTLSRARGYESVTDMLLHPQKVTQEMYHNQLDIIQQELAPHMRKYAKLKQQQLGLDDMRFCDLQVALDPDFVPETTYEEASKTIMDALQVMGPEYSEIIKKGLTERWVDRADNIGKSTGAFCASPYGVHPYILITWTNTMRGAFVLAHELGHAGHFYLAGKYQSLANTRPSTYFVEAPSTLNELLLADHLMEQTKDERMKRWIIDQLLGTYYHNFITHLLEGEYQRRVYALAEDGVPLTADVLSREKQAALQNFWGDAVNIDEGASLTWMRQPHYYMGLYPYTYSAGLTVSTAVAKRIREEGDVAVNDWLEVLKAGGTLKPLELIKKAGIDMSTPEPIKEAVQYVGSLIDQLVDSFK
ncbi:MAG TPA: oligoendopeptidase F [Bacillota bacterium]|nr:oligoendopeptidase F [Bacillota bacterium]